MFDYPSQAKFDQVVSKSKIYSFTKPSRTVREQFVSQIGEITWKYKLSPETVNLPARRGIHEIQVFEVALKTAALGEEPLRAIDKAIASPVFFRLMFEGRVKAIAAYKRPSDSDADKWVVTSYFATDWQPQIASRPPLPVVLDLAALYEHMLRRHLSVPARSAESLSDHVERCLQIRLKEKEHNELATRLRTEKQFNRKVEINAQIRNIKAELEKLSLPDTQ